MKRLALMALAAAMSLGASAQGWQDYTTGTFTDGWILPGFEMDPAKHPIEVTVQKNAAKDFEYRILNPYLSEEFPTLNSTYSLGEGVIVFDLSNPDFVLVRTGYESGVKQYGDPYYFHNTEGYYDALYGFGPQELTDFLAKEGVVLEYSYISADRLTVTFNNCRMDIFPEATYSIPWSGLEGEMVSTLTVDTPLQAGESSLTELDAPTAPIEYFNLQGQRVSDPKGLVIVRQGPHATKIRL